MNNQYSRYAVMIDRFGHDTNGNAVAHHTVFAYSDKVESLDVPAATLYVTKRRQQIGFQRACNDWAGRALAKAGAPAGLPMVRVDGNRSEGIMFLVYDVPAPVETNATLIVYGRKFKTVAFDDDRAANAFMEKNPGWGLLGIGADQKRHVACNTDRGTELDFVVRLRCCCCGGDTTGRQWFNQDTGYGLGACCVDFVAKGTEDMERTYGVRGEHYDLAK